MKRSVLTWLAVALLVTALGCGSISLGGGGSSTSGVDVKVANHTPDEICYVFISPTSQDTWGDDQLGGQDTIAAGASKTFNMGQDTYDVLVEKCDEATMATAWDVSNDTTVDVGTTGADIRLLIDNGSSTEVCYVYISPSTSDQWGDDWMGSKESLQPGSTRIFYVTSGTYDLQVADCDGNSLSEEQGADLTSDLTWTLTN